MELALMTTDDLLAVLPRDNEDDRWELKSAALLEPSKRGDLKHELGKQVSAFANSGGGRLVFGLSNTRVLEPCGQTVSRQSMKDYLATMVEQCVEYPIRTFQVLRIPFTGDDANSLFVVVIEDSPAAPHQAKDDKHYYYRIDGHSKPAPHFHVELLRNRMTKAIVEIKDAKFELQSVETKGDCRQLNVRLNVELENRSMQAASHCGVHVVGPQEDYRWQVGKNPRYLAEGACIHAEQPVLLPSERSIVPLFLSTQVPLSTAPLPSFTQNLLRLAVGLQSVSQNYVGQERSIRIDRIGHSSLFRELERQLSPFCP